MISRVSCFHSDCELQLVLSELIYEGKYLVRGLELRGNAIIHDYELTIRRHDSQRFRMLEIRSIHTLMKIAVIQDSVMEAMQLVMLPYNEIII